MAQTASIVLTLAVAATSAAAVALTVAPRDRAGAPESLAADVAELADRVARLEAAHAAAAAAAAPAAMPAAATRTELPLLTDAQIDAAFARWQAARDGMPAAAAATAAADQGAAIDLGAEFERLRGNSNYWNNADLYARLFAAGRIDELVARFEQSARDNPRDPAAQMDLANAYLANLQLDRNKWQLALKADQSLDKVLALDDHHWAARFTKAMSYSFYPDFLGKKKDAIANFELLVEQQDQMPQRPEFAQTYLYLGNLLEQRGETERARATWERGARLYPEDAGLRDRLLK